MLSSITGLHSDWPLWTESSDPCSEGCATGGSKYTNYWGLQKRDTAAQTTTVLSESHHPTWLVRFWSSVFEH